MKDCLITTLKANSDNNELLKDGEVRISFGAASGLGIRSSVSQECLILSGNLRYDGSTSVPLNANEWAHGTVSGTKGLISIPDKYNIINLEAPIDGFHSEDWLYGSLQTLSFNNSSNISPEDCIIDVDDIAQMKLTSLVVGTNYKQFVSGNLSSLAGNTRLTTFNVAGNLSGTMGDLARMYAVTSYGSSVGQNQIYGSCEQFVNVRRTAPTPQTTGSVTFNWLGSEGRVTFNGQAITNVQSNTLSWTASTITLNGTTIDA